MGKGSNFRVTWTSTFARQYDRIFGKKTSFDLSDVFSHEDIESDLDFKGGHKTKRNKKCCKK
jgi:hypothetical protein